MILQSKTSPSLLAEAAQDECEEPSSGNRCLLHNSQGSQPFEEQFQYNRDTRFLWESYSHHRKIVTDILVRSIKASEGRLCLIGAGNSNDVDLVTLLDTYSRIDLVDIDNEALEAGVQKQLHQTQALRERVFLHGGVDVLGIPDGVKFAEVVPLLRSGAVQSQIAALIGGEGGCDVVAGLCIISQLFVLLRKRLTEQGADGKSVVDEATRPLMEQYVGTLAAAAKERNTSVVIHFADLAQREDGFLRETFTQDEIMKDHFYEPGHILSGSNPGFYYMDAHKTTTKLTNVSFESDDGGETMKFWSWCIGSKKQGKCLVVYSMQWIFNA